SSAHLIIIPWLFGWSDPALTSLTFDVALHLGTLVALLAFFAADWIRLLKAGVRSLIERKIGDDVDRKLAWMLVIGSIPGGIVGVLVESRIEAWFHPADRPIAPVAMIAMAIIIALLGAALLGAERIAPHRRTMDHLTFKDAVLVGLSQALAVFPGVSRSGATITTGLAVGLERETAARFSFLLSAPIIAGAGAKSLVEILQGMRSGAIARADLLLFPVGFLAAAVSGYLCIRYLLRFLQRHSTDVFVYYRWGLAVVLLVVALLRA
ncbi:MAG: undecaprenyl-diphosphate phosphatase, partial [Actinobacteria bacterium]|nr:undecaprenyl-diphosphate phosphatase [Actinomycetota bacterium]